MTAFIPTGTQHFYRSYATHCQIQRTANQVNPSQNAHPLR
jgi:hypothetical protein